MKITIIGASNAGKSSLARKISRKYNISYLQIDRTWFEANGHIALNSKDDTLMEKVRGELKEKIDNFLNENTQWVIDGTYLRIQDKIAIQADVVVFIDRPLLLRIVSQFIRAFTEKYRHPEVTTWQDILFIKHIIKRSQKNEQMKLKTFTDKYTDKLVILKSFKEIDKFFEQL